MLAPHAVSRDQLMGLSPGIVAALDGGSTAESAPEETRGTSDPVSEDSGGRIEEGVLIGDPVGDSRYWFQQAQNGFCLPASIAQIVSEYTGVIYQDEFAFVDIANEIGAFVVGYDGVPGTPFEKGVEILNRAGYRPNIGLATSNPSQPALPEVTTSLSLSTVERSGPVKRPKTTYLTTLSSSLA